MVVAGTDAAATVLPHPARQLIAPRAQRADVAAQAGGPGGWPTLMCQVLTTRARDQGSRPQPSLLAQPLGKDLQAPAPTWPPTPAWHQQPGDQAPPSRASTSPTAAARGSSAPCSPPPSPHCAPTPSARPTTSANATKTNRHGPGRPRPTPTPHPDPARHDPQPHPLQPTTINTTTRSRLTHHTGTPPWPWSVVTLSPRSRKDHRKEVQKRRRQPCPGSRDV